MKKETLYCFVVCFALGVVFRFSIDIGTVFPMFLIGLSIFLIVLARGGKTCFSQGLIVSLCVLAFSLGVLRFDVAERMASSRELHDLIGENVLIEGVISGEPDERENSIRLTVCFEKVFWNETDFDIQTKGIVTAALYPKWNYGDRVVLEGVLKKPENFSSDTGREFNYVGYLAKDGIYYQMFKPEMTLVARGEGSFVKQKLFEWKGMFLGNISRVIHEPYAALLGGLTVGAKQSLGKDLLDDFRATGLIHIVVLSGYNVTIIIIALMRLLAFLPRRATAAVGVVGVVLFTIMVGAGATIVRASIMALLIIFARTVGRQIDIMRLLFFAGFLMILHNPYIVMFDPSFQLSFMAMLGLILLAPIFESYLKFIPKKFGLREIAAATIATQIFVLPLLLYMMGEVSLVAIVVNLLVLIFIPITMLLGFITGMLGFVSTTLSLVFALPTFMFLYYEIVVVELFARLPFASVAVPNFSLSLMFLVYIIYGVGLWRLYKNRAVLPTTSLESSLGSETSK